MLYGELGDETTPADCVAADPQTTVELFYRNDACKNHTASTGEPIQRQKFRARCLVLLVEAASHRALFEEMIGNGRVPTDQLRVQLTLMTTTAAEPDYGVASTHAGISYILQEAHAADLVGRADLEALLAAEQNVTAATARYELVDDTLKGLDAYAPPTPPMAPGGMEYGEYLDLLDDERAAAEAHLAALRTTAAADCVSTPTLAMEPDATHTCGRSELAAPDPWVADDGTLCRGYATKEVMFEDFCARWSSDVNTRAADAELTEELLTTNPPYCVGVDERVHACSVYADRTSRAGVDELFELSRPDRRFYCANPYFREKFVERENMSEEECRNELLGRRSTCELELCPECRTQCPQPLLRMLAGMFKCTLARDQAAITFGLEVSDQGQLAKASHGAIRGDKYIAVPSYLGRDVFRRLHDNADGLLQRDGVSCRKLHRTSQRGHFAHGFSEKTGNPIARTGYMVECLTNADCHRLCGRHPLTSSHYTCQKRFEMFDYAKNTNSSVLYLTSERGAGNVSDPREGMGVCVDSNALLYQSCPNEGLANVVDTVVGCVRALSSNLRPPATLPLHLISLSPTGRPRHRALPLRPRGAYQERRPGDDDHPRQPRLPARARRRVGGRGRRRPFRAPHGVRRPDRVPSALQVPLPHLGQWRRHPADVRALVRAALNPALPPPVFSHLLSSL